MHYYKVVKKNLCSIWTSDFDTLISSERTEAEDTFRVQYKENEWVFPNLEGSKLFVFCDKKLAIKFTDNMLGMLYICQVQNPIKKAPFVPEIKIEPMRTFNIWKNYKNKKGYKKLIYDLTAKPPEGTIWCDAVKLENLIYRSSSAFHMSLLW